MYSASDILAVLVRRSLEYTTNARYCLAATWKQQHNAGCSSFYACSTARAGLLSWSHLEHALDAKTISWGSPVAVLKIVPTPATALGSYNGGEVHANLGCKQLPLPVASPLFLPAKTAMLPPGNLLHVSNAPEEKQPSPNDRDDPWPAARRQGSEHVKPVGLASCKKPLVLLKVRPLQTLHMNSSRGNLSC